MSGDRRPSLPNLSVGPAEPGSRRGPVPLDSVLRTDELASRPARATDHAAENRALAALLEALGQGGDVLQDLVDHALDLCRAHSAGISLLETDPAGRQQFRWQAVAGRWAVHLGGTMPRERSPCGTVLDRDQPQLMAFPERHYLYGSGIDLPIAEALLVPFHSAGRPVGTVWVLAHDDGRRFDREDLRLLTSLSRFAGLALQLIERDRLRSQLATRAAIDHERAVELAGMRRLQALSALLIQAGDETTLYEHVLDAAKEFMGSDTASLQMYHPERDELRLLANIGFEPEAAAAWHWISPAAGTVCGRALRARQRVVVPDVTTSPLLAGSEHARTYVQAGIRAVQSTPLLSRSGQIVGMLSTHWRRPHGPAEEELRLLDVLARQAADLLERTQGEQALREGDRRKSEFLSMLAHELRNPLASIHNALEIVRLMGDDAQAVQQASAIMSRQVGQLVRVVDDLLDLSRISRGRIELRKGEVDLATVIHQAVEAVAPMAKHFEQPLTVELPPRPVRLQGDAARLAQVFTNLLNNACKYSERGARIQVSVHTPGRDGGHGDGAHGEGAERRGRGAPSDVVVRVKDEGIGIAADQLGRIFELFAQVDSSIERSQGGLGIGLTLVKSLVEQHGGRVEARSEGLGKGSEFIVHLPMTRPEGAEERAGPQGEAGRGATWRILVVDDNRDSADSLALLLRSAGHETMAAYGGEEALELAGTYRPDVVLLDLGMPLINGYEACRRIRSEPWGRDMIFIAQTGWGQDEDRNLTEAAGFHGHLTKPVNQNDLARLLATLAGMQGA